MRFFLAEKPLTPLNTQIETKAPTATTPRPKGVSPALWYWTALPPTVPETTETPTVTGLEVEPLVPVTVTVYVPRGVKGVVVTVRIDWPEPPGDKATLVGFREVVMVGLLPVTALDRRTVPEKPLLPRLMVEVPELPAEIVKEFGDAVIEKLGAALTIGSKRIAASTSPRDRNLRMFNWCKLTESRLIW
jgi:hypothetical protein